MRREQLDDAFPTIVRYVGVVLAVGVAVAAILGKGADVASVSVLALGMILFKTVKGAVSEETHDPGDE